jgi:hypothetical protein
MHSTTNNDRKRVGFAVIRSFQPTRIERELLAQVFELASQGVNSQSDVTGSSQQPCDRASQGTSEHELAIPGAIDCRGAQDSQLERAA